MRQWLASIFAVLFALLAACGDPPAKTGQSSLPSAEFLALPLEQRNLAIYDAFWAHIDANHYDPATLSTDEWRARRAEWRIKAAATKWQQAIYSTVLDPLTKLMPESHVFTQPPAVASAPVGEPVGRYSARPAMPAARGSPAPRIQSGATAGRLWCSSARSRPALPKSSRLRCKISAAVWSSAA